MWARLAYSTLCLFAPLVVLPVFFCFKRGRKHVWERLGLWSKSKQKHQNVIWFHGASLGEHVGLKNIADRLRTFYPNHFFLATLTSPTGLNKAKEYSDQQYLLPFDHPFYFASLVKSFAPSLFICAEADIWPNLAKCLKQHGAKLVLVNGRLGAGNNFRFKLNFFKEVLALFNFFYVVQDKFASQLLEAGVDPQKIEKTLNTKYDSPSKQTDSDKQKISREAFFLKTSKVFVVASLRPGEEQLLFSALAKLLNEFDDLAVVIAPRHAEKFRYFEAQLKQFDLKYVKRSQLQGPSQTQILFLDTQGELAELINFADLCFVGGSLVPGYGGHNVMEPAQRGVAVCVGPYHSKVSDLVDGLLPLGALSVIDCEQSLIDLLNRDSIELKQMGAKAEAFAQSFQGCASLLADRIQRLKD